MSPVTPARRAGPIMLSLMLTLLVLGTFTVRPTQASFSQAAIRSNPNSNHLGYLGFEYELTTGSVLRCAVQGAVPATCAGYPFTMAAATTTPTSSTSRAWPANGVSTTGYKQQVRVASCSPTQFVNSATTGAGSLLPRNRISRQVSGPWGSTVAAGFAGRQFAGSVNTTTPSSFALGSYSMGAWFKVPPTSLGGGIMTLSTNPVNGAVSGVRANPGLYIDGNGAPHFVAAQAQGGIDVAAPSGYRDDQWHLLVVTVTRLSQNTSVVMYVDGQQVASNALLPLQTAATTGHYWKVGWIDFPGINPVATHLTGSLSGVFVSSVAMSPSMVTALRQAPSAAAYAATIPSPQQLWMLGESVTSTYDGNVPFVDVTGDPCSQVQASWNIGSVTALDAEAISVLETRGWQPNPGVGAPTGDNSSNQGWYRRMSPYDADVATMELRVVFQYRYVLGANWSTVLTFDRMVLLG